MAIFLKTIYNEIFLIFMEELVMKECRKYSAFLMLFTILTSCFFPESRISEQNSISPHYPDSHIRPIIYRNYKDICNTTWQSEDQQVRVQFANQEKLASLFYKDKEYHLTNFDYYDGIFAMETALQDQHTYTPWTIVVVLRPDSQNEAWFNVFGRGISEIGTLKRTK